MWKMVTGKLYKKISSDKDEQNGLKLTNRFTYEEEEETECLMQEDDQGVLGMFMIGKRNIFKLGKERKVKSIPNEDNFGGKSNRQNKMLFRTRKEQNFQYFKTENQFKTLSDNSEEEISNIIKRLNILQMKKNNLKKC